MDEDVELGWMRQVAAEAHLGARERGERPRKSSEWGSGQGRGGGEEEGGERG